MWSVEHMGPGGSMMGIVLVASHGRTGPVIERDMKCGPCHLGPEEIGPKVEESYQAAIQPVFSPKPRPT
jgi:hypothetical protein